MHPALILLLVQVPAAPPPETEPPPRYGDAGTSHFGAGLGLGSGGGGFQYAVGIDYGYFLFAGIAPGIDLHASGGTGLLTTGLVLGSLRLLPVRTSRVSLLLVGRGGRVLLSDHADGWGAGGGAGLIFHVSGRVGFQIGYDVLLLSPGWFCADLAQGCVLQGLAIGIVAGF